MPHVRSQRPDTQRRGVTLVEMLIAVTLLVLMMTIIVQVFLAATSTLSAARTYQELDSSLRQLDSTLRLDLQNLTAPLTPPLDPKNNQGYFEYGENEFADLQGEDCDDYLRFTVRAPEGHVFTGRMLASFGAGVPSPITITSRIAEVIYFLRNGNLYRRVLLVAPDQNPFNSAGVFPQAYFGGVGVSWQGLNDISSHPVENFNSLDPSSPIRLNTLGDLTNRENRWPAPRFINDFVATGDTSLAQAPDGIPDDTNGDSVPDFWPSLYPGAITAGLTNTAAAGTPPIWGTSFATQANMGFPYVYGYAYSVPDTLTASVGWIHAPDPFLNTSKVSSLGWLATQNRINHGPLGIGDSLPGLTGANDGTWWGFPTWRETMSPNWHDPFVQLSINGQPVGLTPRSPLDIPPGSATSLANFLPPLTAMPPASWSVSPWTVPLRAYPQTYTDGLGAASFAVLSQPGFTPDALWKQLWEDDLVMTGVRSFDVKGYDDSYAGYVDLGWGDDLRQYAPYAASGVVDPTSFPPASASAVTLSSATPPLLGSLGATSVVGSGGTLLPFATFTWPPTAVGNVWKLYDQTLAHEGRMPPLAFDRRHDPRSGINLGDDVQSGNIGNQTIRLRRVYDTWSTDYSNAPSSGVNPANGSPIGVPFGLPIYPSYPAPYPVKLRGVQIQVRVVDPKSERLKVLTIRQNFDD